MTKIEIGKHQSIPEVEVNVSSEYSSLVEKLKTYRRDTKLIEKLKFENAALKEQNDKLIEDTKILTEGILERGRLLDKTSALELNVREIELKLKRTKQNYRFIVTTPQATETVRGEIKTIIKNAQREVLICSPWFNYIVDEISHFTKDAKAKKLRVIIRFEADDIKSGITDLDKLRMLLDIGAQVRFNNLLHAKMVIVDSSVAVISSANLTKKGLTMNYEAGVCIKGKEELEKAIEFYNGLWNESEPLTSDRIEKEVKRFGTD